MARQGQGAQAPQAALAGGTPSMPRPPACCTSCCCCCQRGSVVRASTSGVYRGDTAAPGMGGKRCQGLELVEATQAWLAASSGEKGQGWQGGSGGCSPVMLASDSSREPFLYSANARRGQPKPSHSRRQARGTSAGSEAQGSQPGSAYETRAEVHVTIWQHAGLAWYIPPLCVQQHVLTCQPLPWERSVV